MGDKVGQAVLDQERSKQTLYAPLVSIAAKQQQDGKRQHTPKFIAAAASTLGEIGPQLATLQEWLVAMYARNIASAGHRDDGMRIQTLTARYRNRF